jgi:hypothetical protein
MASFVLAIVSGVLWPGRPSPLTCPMPCFSRVSSWLEIGSLGADQTKGHHRGQLNAFSLMVILRSSLQRAPYEVSLPLSTVARHMRSGHRWSALFTVHRSVRRIVVYAALARALRLFPPGASDRLAFLRDVGPAGSIRRIRGTAWGKTGNGASWTR